MRRVVITNPTIGIQNFSVTQDDYEKGVGTPSAFNLPVASGYILEILDYDKTGTIYSNFTTHGKTYPGYDSPNSPYTLVNYAKQNFSIVAGNNSVTITMVPITALPSITPPASITGSFDGSTTFTASASFPASGPFDASSNWTLLGGYTSTALIGMQSGMGASLTAIAPSPYVNGTFVSQYYLAGKFSIKSSLIKSGDGSNFNVVTAATAPITLTYNSGTITPPAN